MKKKLSVISTVIMIILMVAVVATVAPRFFGYRIFPVTEDGMEPELKKGDAVYTVSARSEDIRIYDVISFVADESLNVKTQRVFDDLSDDKCFITRGDGDPAAESSTVMYENVLGVVKFSVPLLGYALSFGNSTVGKLAIIGVIAVFAFLSIFLDRGKVKRENAPDNNKNSDSSLSEQNSVDTTDSDIRP